MVVRRRGNGGVILLGVKGGRGPQSVPQNPQSAKTLPLQDLEPLRQDHLEIIL